MCHLLFCFQIVPWSTMLLVQLCVSYCKKLCSKSYFSSYFSPYVVDLITPILQMRKIDQKKQVICPRTYNQQSWEFYSTFCLKTQAGSFLLPSITANQKYTWKKENQSFIRDNSSHIETHFEKETKAVFLVLRFFFKAGTEGPKRQRKEYSRKP